MFAACSRFQCLFQGAGLTDGVTQDLAERPLEDQDLHFQYRLLPQRHRGLRFDMLACEFRIAPDIAGSTYETGDDPLAIC